MAESLSLPLVLSLVFSLTLFFCESSFPVTSHLGEGSPGKAPCTVSTCFLTDPVTLHKLFKYPVLKCP